MSGGNSFSTRSQDRPANAGEYSSNANNPASRNRASIRDSRFALHRNKEAEPRRRLTSAAG